MAIINLLSNPSFKQGIGFPWQEYHENGGTVLFTLDTDAQDGDNACARLEVITSPGRYAKVRQLIYATNLPLEILLNYGIYYKSNCPVTIGVVAFTAGWTNAAVLVSINLPASPDAYTYADAGQVVIPALLQGVATWLVDFSFGIPFPVTSTTDGLNPWLKIDNGNILYEEPIGTLTVQTTPVAGEISIGAVDGPLQLVGTGFWSGDVAIGTYVVSFGPVTGYSTPPNQTVTVVTDTPTSITGTYEPINGPECTVSANCQTLYGNPALNHHWECQAGVCIEVPDDDSNGGCFIATAAFGSPLATELNTFRRFRDNCLPQRLTNIYYIVGKYPARLIASSGILRRYVKTTLNLIKELIENTHS